jgi:hypothetical protein
MSDDTHETAGDDTAPEPAPGAPGPGEPGRAAVPSEAPGWPVADGTPTLTTPADTTRLGEHPTTVDPSLPPLPPVAPSWSSPSTPPPTAPTYPAPGSTAYPPAGAAPPPAPPQDGAPAPQYGTPQYAAPTYGAPAYGAPQYAAPPGPYGEPHGVGLPGVAGWGAVPMAPKPGVVPLRPLGVGEILDGAISYIRRDPKTVLGISAVISLVIAVVQFAALAATSRSLNLATGSASFADALASGLGSVSASAVQSLVAWVLGVVATGLLTVVMGQAVLGRRVTASQAWDRTRARFWPLLGLTLLVSVVEGVLVVVGLGVAVLAGWALTSASTGLGVTVGILLGIAAVALVVWVSIRLLLAPVALMLESAGVVTSMRRSWTLVQGAWWRTFGIYVLGSILAAIVSSVLAIPFSLVGALLSLGSIQSGTLPIGYTLSVSLATLVSSIVVIPFTSGIVSLLYIDRRIRREALDIELARAAGVAG